MSTEAEKLLKEINTLKRRLQDISNEDTGRSFNDVVHGQNTFLPSLLWKLVDTPIFQRLRYIHQLGTMSFVFPNATHSRFEHSLGVAFLAGEWLKHFRRLQPELEITEREIHLVQIAGLFHDIGHGPFSHAFESGFVSTLDSSVYKTEWEHEDASIALTRRLLQNFNEENPSEQFSEEEIQMVENCILGKIPESAQRNGRSFLYQIVANKVNSIDVDKFDYLKRDTLAIGKTPMFSFERLFKFSRVINGNICFRQGQEENIYMMFVSRFHLHKQIYTHKVVVAFDLMIGDILKKADKVLSVSKIFDRTRDVVDYDRYLTLDDGILRTIETSNDPGLDEAKKLVERLRRRQLYKWVARTSVNRDNITSEKKRLEKKFKQDPQLLVEGVSQFIIKVQKFNFALKDKNPMDKVLYYTDDCPNISFEIPSQAVSELIPGNFEHCYLDIYVKDKKLVENVVEVLGGDSIKFTFSPKVQPQDKLMDIDEEEIDSSIQRNLFQNLDDSEVTM